MRDSVARKINRGVETLLKNKSLYLIARTVSIDLDDGSANEEFLYKVNEQIDISLSTFPSQKGQLLKEN